MRTSGVLRAPSQLDPVVNPNFTAPPTGNVTGDLRPAFTHFNANGVYTAPNIAVETRGTVAATALVVGSLAGRLRALASTDALTGLPNRRGWEASLPVEREGREFESRRGHLYAHATWPRSLICGR